MRASSRWSSRRVFSRSHSASSSSGGGGGVAFGLVLFAESSFAVHAASASACSVTFADALSESRPCAFGLLPLIPLLVVELAMDSRCFAAFSCSSSRRTSFSSPSSISSACQMSDDWPQMDCLAILVADAIDWAIWRPASPSALPGALLCAIVRASLSASDAGSMIFDVWDMTLAVVSSLSSVDSFD